MKDLFNRKKHTFFLLHILCWGIVFCGPFFPPNNISSSETSFAIKYFVKMGMVFCFFYLNYFVLIDKFLFNKKFSKFIVSNLLLITLFATLTQIFFKLFDSCRQSVEYISLDFGILLQNFIPFLTALAFVLCAKLLLKWLHTEREKNKISNLKSECELKNLRNQLNPHFLINSLNSIYALICLSQKQAQQALISLSNLLRYTLSVNNCESVPLRNEIAFLKDYIDLMRLRQRKDGIINTRFEVSEMTSFNIAPMLHINLIENAFKHGVSPDKQSRIDICIKETDNGITSTISNTFFPQKSNETKEGGVGLDLLLKRLEAQYKDKYEYNVYIKDGFYTVTLDIILQ